MRSERSPDSRAQIEERMSYCLKREKEPLLDNESEPGSEDRYQKLLLAGT